IENAQRKVEAMNFDIRKQLLEYDNVMNKQREAVYSLRNGTLEGEDISEQIKTMIEESIEEKIDLWCAKKHPEEWDWQSMALWLKRVFDIELVVPEKEVYSTTKETLKETVNGRILDFYKTRENNFGTAAIRELERIILLHMIDIAWKEHLYELDQLKKGIGLRAYGQKDPLVEYQRESFAIFNQMMTRIRESSIEYIFRVQPVTPTLTRGNQTRQPEGIAGRHPLQSPKQAPRGGGSPQPAYGTATIKKLGRNDPCPCGSGKKYKKCCGQ
ncbi:MAG: SEC-C domain-containing protein, partial [Elusimicrobia bacterium]|nr:SEC-C domain-containing protein [Elusimicrobiota bacterium]